MFINSIKWKFSKIETTWITLDNNKEYIEDDILKRKIELNHFVKLTEELPEKLKTSFVIGISGEWGYGKTSFVQMAKNILNKKNNHIFVDFNPWFTSETQNLIEDFFITLDNEISKHIQTKNTILKYGKTLANINQPTNILSNFKDLLITNYPLKDRFYEISLLIEKLDKRVYILIDDLDRLNNSEVFETLRLIKNTASFPNFIFIIAYDKSYLENALKNIKILKPNKYLEKIIQFEITLPRISSDIIINHIAKSINSKIENIFANNLLEKESFKKQIRNLILDWSEFELTRQEDHKYRLGLLLSQILLNIRDVIRFSNSFIFSVKNHYDKVYLPDLFIIELIKFSNPKLFVRLYNNNYLISKQNTDGLYYYELFDNEIVEEKIFYKPDYKISDILKNFNGSEIEKKLIYKLFALPNLNDFNSQLSISYTENFNYYFTLFIESYQVSFKDIYNFIKGNTPISVDKHKNEFLSTEFIMEKEESLLQKLQFNLNISNKEELGNYLSILMALFERGNYEVVNNIFLRKVISRKFNFITEENSKKELFQLVEEKAIFPYLGISKTVSNLITSYIYNKPEEKDLRNKIPEKDFLLSINHNFLKKYFSETENHKFEFEVYINLYYNCLNEIATNSREIKISKFASEILYKKIVDNRELFEDYLRHFFRESGIRYSVKEFNSREIGPEPFFEQIFGNLNNFLSELRKQNTQVSLEIQRYFKRKKKDATVSIDDLNLTKNLHLNLFK
tara:strand:- start:1582 stop:3798 length:2217 start_codon:yes stop_codon:yes gene_type:complete